MNFRRDNWEPTPHSTVCSWHFPEGREKGPTRFAWNKEKLFSQFPEIDTPKRK